MKNILILQMRPENETADSEFEAILRVGKIDREQVHRIRVEQLEKFEIDINNYCAIIAGGSPFDVSCPDNKKSDLQKKIESFFNSLFNQVIALDIEYVDKLSFLFDVKILWLTLIKVLKREGVNQSDERPMQPFNGNN